MRAVGFDPGLAETGFAVLEGAAGRFAVLGSGVVRTAAGDLLEVRLDALFVETQAVLERFQPDLVVVEDVFSTPTIPRAAILTGYARAVIYLAGRRRNLPLLAVSPAEVKRSVTRSGAAPKAQVARAVQAILSLDQLPRPSHVADALALAFTGLSRGPVALPGAVAGLAGAGRR